MHDQIKNQFEEGHLTDRHRYFSMFMRDAAGVIDSLLLTFEDTHGTVSKRTTKQLYRKYESRVDDEEPELDPSSFGHALAALEEMGLIERDRDCKRGRWILAETDPRQLVVVRCVTQDPELRVLYQNDR